MFVKFTKAQIKALKSIEPSAQRLFNQMQCKYPSSFPDDQRDRIVAFFCFDTLEHIIKSGEIWLENFDTLEKSK